MIIDCLADLHGHYPKLEGGDLLIVAGDLTARDTFPEYCDIFQKISRSQYRKKIVIAGNHDKLLQTDDWFAKMSINFDYLCDSGTEFEGLKIWGSPWTKTFPGMNPHCKAFTVDTEKGLALKFSLIPEDTDILVTHEPPYGILDGIPIKDGSLFHVGSKSLFIKVGDTNPILHIFGHIHEGYGEFPYEGKYLTTRFVNASHVNERYEPVNKPIRIIL